MARKTKVNLQSAKLFAHIRARSPAAADAALREIKEATDPLTPRDTGALIASGSVSEGRIAYTAPYAARQHEDLSYRHSNGGAKYLERGIRAGSKAASEAIMKVMKF